MNHSNSSTERSIACPLIIVLEFSVILACGIVGRYEGRRSAQNKNLKDSETIMEDTTTESTTVDPTAKALPQATREELRRTPIALPTIALLFVAYFTYLASLYGYIQSLWHWSISTCLSTIAIYWSFTVLHDAVHIAIAPKYRKLNEVCGHLAGLLLFAPMQLFRFVHLNHHRYAGDDELDPDAWAGRGPMIALPLRWASVVFYYIYYFSRSVRQLYSFRFQQLIFRAYRLKCV